MSTINAYQNTNVVAGKLADAAQLLGSPVRKMVGTFEVAAADDNGSIYRVFKGLSPDIVVTNILVGNDAITGGTAYDIGLYGVLDYDGVGAVVSANCFANNLDVSSAHVSGSELSGISAVDVANRGKRLYEIAGHTQLTKLPAYDLCVTADTVGSGAGTVTVILEYVV